MKKVLLDTSAYSLLLRGNRDVLRCLEDADIVFIPFVVMAELFVGFKGGTREKHNLEIFNAFLDQSSVRALDVTCDTSEVFADIFIRLKSSGTPLPIHDVWIAAHSIEQGAVLITADKHFATIAALRVHFIEQ